MKTLIKQLKYKRSTALFAIGLIAWLGVNLQK